VSEEYNDGRVQLDATGLHIHGYYFPWGSKVIPFSSIRGLQRVGLTGLRGKWRIWGTANMGYWANLDTTRPKKKIGFVVDVGTSVRPFVTPDDPDAFETELRHRAGLGPSDGTTSPSPIL